MGTLHHGAPGRPALRRGIRNTGPHVRRSIPREPQQRASGFPITTGPRRTKDKIRRNTIQINGIGPAEHGRARVLALVTDAFGGYGGIALYNRDFLSALCTHPRVSEVVALPRVMPQPPEAVPARLTHVTSSLGGKWRYAFALLKTIRANRKFEAIVCGHVNLLPIAYLAGALTGARIILLIYGIEAWKPSASLLSRFALRGVAAYVSISQVTRDRFLKWARVGHAPGYILPNAIHLERYQPGHKDEELVRRYGLTGKRVIMTFGRLAGAERYKGFDETMEVLQQVAEQVPNLVYMVVGEGSDRARLTKKAQALGIEDRVVFTGFVAEEEKAGLYRLADAYVMPSRGEGFGFVILEALATGIPTVASKVDGGREAVRDGMLGLLVDPDSPTEIHQAIVAALRRPKEVLDGLDYFSFKNFERRLHAMVDECVGPDSGTPEVLRT